MLTPAFVFYFWRKNPIKSVSTFIVNTFEERTYTQEQNNQQMFYKFQK